MKLIKNINRKYLALTLLLFILSGKDGLSKQWVYFKGSVTEIETANPVPDYPVSIIINDSLTLVDIFTDQQGNYYDSVFIDPVAFNNVFVAVYDCEGMISSHYFQEMDSINVADFTICVNQSDCNALIGIEPDSTNIYQIQFLNLSSGNFNKCTWEFGDGFMSDECDPVHQFTEEGTYEVCLTIEDTLGSCYDTFCFLMSIGEPNCQAGFNWYQDDENDFKVHFTDLSTGEISSWFWDFGDMTYSSEQSPVHQYASQGEYAVTLTVYDSLGFCFDTETQYIYLLDSLSCVADFTAMLDTLNNIPNVFYFMDNSEGNPENWLWDFGDGEVSFEQNPIHTYEQSGSYEVCLTISSNNGANDCFDTKCQTINTLDYFNFGGQVFIGDYPINIEEEDSSNIAVAYLYRRFMNKWELMDTREFWKFGYYWFTEKPEGEYIIRTDLLPASVEYGNYAPVYHNNESSWNNADIFNLNDDDEFAINVRLKPLLQYQTGIGSISGRIEPGLDCETNMLLEGELVYLLNADHQMISFTYTNEFGVFTFDGLGLTNYFVKAEITGKVSPRVNIQLSENNPFADEILLDVKCNSYVGVDESQTISNFVINNIYPQPASDRLTIELNNGGELSYQLKIISIDGKTLWKKTINTVGDKQIIDIDVSSFIPGLYLLMVSEMDGIETNIRKIIIN